MNSSKKYIVSVSDPSSDVPFQFFYHDRGTALKAAAEIAFDNLTGTEHMPDDHVCKDQGICTCTLCDHLNSGLAAGHVEILNYYFERGGTASLPKIWLTEIDLTANDHSTPRVEHFDPDRRPPQGTPRFATTSPCPVTVEPDDRCIVVEKWSVRDDFGMVPEIVTSTADGDYFVDGANFDGTLADLIAAGHPHASELLYVWDPAGKAWNLAERVRNG